MWKWASITLVRDIYRVMSSVQGRFSSPDPDNYDARLGLPQSWNMYAYTWNNPLKFKDDDGRAVNLGQAYNWFQQLVWQSQPQCTESWDPGTNTLSCH